MKLVTAALATAMTHHAACRFLPRERNQSAKHAVRNTMTLVSPRYVTMEKNAIIALNIPYGTLYPISVSFTKMFPQLLGYGDVGLLLLRVAVGAVFLDRKS